VAVVRSRMLVDPSRLALFVGAALVLLVTPGPAVLYITARAMSQGVRAGLVSVLAVETGNSVQVLGAAVGLAALLASSALAFSVVKLLGAGYLVVLGVRKLASGRDGTPAGGQEARPASLRAVYVQGVVVSVLNPKTALFFLAFLPQFVDPARGHVTAQMLVLGATFVALALISDGAYALLAGTVGRWLWRHPRFVRGERYVSGSVYIGLGAYTALSGSGAARVTVLPAP
jgi:threonine/homoserine/homoserine lactone efflux protein